MMASTLRTMVLLSALICLFSCVSFSNGVRLDTAVAARREAKLLAKRNHFDKRMDAGAPAAPHSLNDRQPLGFYFGPYFQRPQTEPQLNEEQKELEFSRFVHYNGKPIMYAGQVIPHNVHRGISSYGSVYLVGNQPTHPIAPHHFSRAADLDYSPQVRRADSDQLYNRVTEAEDYGIRNGHVPKLLVHGRPFPPDPRRSNHGMFKLLTGDPDWRKVEQKATRLSGDRANLDRVRQALIRDRMVVTAENGRFHAFVLNKNGRLFAKEITNIITFH